MAAVLSPGQETRDSETVRYRSFPEIVEEIARAIETSGKPAAVVWVVDNASMLQSSKHGDLMAEAIPRAFGSNKTRTHHAVLSMGPDDAGLVLKPSEDLAAVSRAIQTLAGSKPDDRIKNCLANLRTAAKVAAATGSPKRVVVLFTQENGDNEDDLEATVRTFKSSGVLFFAIAGEAVYADPYWESVIENSSYHSTSEADKFRKLKFQLRGPECGYVEFPYGWPLQFQDPAYTVPSGFGTYGLNRLATLTGGKYFLYNIDRSSGTFCQRYGCPLCSGRHKECGGAYDVTKLRMTGPDIGSRDQIRDRLSRERLFLALLGTWERLNRSGLLRGAPRLKATGGRLVEAKASGTSGSPFTFGADWKTNRGQAMRTAAELDRIVAEFAQVLADEGSRGDKRVLATADAFHLHLRVLRWNLVQLALFCEEMDRAARQKRPAGENPFSGAVFDDCTGCRSGSYGIRPVYLCHGGAALKDVRLLGGEAEEKDKRELLDLADRVIEKHRGTPWEVLVRRAALLIFTHAGD